MYHIAAAAIGKQEQIGEAIEGLRLHRRSINLCHGLLPVVPINLQYMVSVFAVVPL